MNLGRVGDFVIKDSWIEKEIRHSRENSANKIVSKQRQLSAGKVTQQQFNQSQDKKPDLNNRLHIPRPS
jgi:hypothetical protein